MEMGGLILIWGRRKFLCFENARFRDLLYPTQAGKKDQRADIVGPTFQVDIQVCTCFREVLWQLPGRYLSPLTSLSKFTLLHDMVDSRKKGVVGLALNS
jgi:hypothetical protein